MVDKQKDINFIGKIAKFPKNTKAKNAFFFLENIKVSKKKLWYILIEKDIDGLQIVKYNNKTGCDLNKLINEIKNFYSKNEKLSIYMSELVIDGEDKFSVIRNIPDVEIDGKKLITIITSDLIKLLH